MNFAERNGFENEKGLQIKEIDEALRNRLFSLFIKFLSAQNVVDKHNSIEYIMDRLGYISLNNEYMETALNERFMRKLTECKWYDPYTILELFIIEQTRTLECSSCNIEYSEDYCSNSSFVKFFPVAINRILEQEKSAYRLIDGIFVPITNDSEIKSIEECIKESFAPAGIHLKKALEKYSDRESPDYENSIKESISAVESVCCKITGLSGKSVTLGKTLKKLKDNGIEIHGALESAFSQLYGYTSDADGIRHGGIDFTNAPAEDAKYMLVSCSAFINYLKEKYSKLGGQA